MLLTQVRSACWAVAFSMSLGVLHAQPVSAANTVPRTVRFTGSFHPADGLPPQSMEGVTVAVYRDQTGGDPLWQETQNVSMDSSGNFAIQMGGTQNDGLPLDLLRSGEPRWVGVRVNRPGETEQPRVQMLSVPYALRASDAETLGGLPASAYLTNPAAATLNTSSAAVAVAGTATAGAKALKPRITSGTTNYIGVFTNTTDLGNSVLYQNGARIGLNTTSPFDYFHAVFNDATGSFTGFAVQNLGSGAASYSGTLFYDQNGALGQFQGFNNSTHEYRINNIASNGSINFLIGGSSKFLVAHSGNIGIGTPSPGSALDVTGDINFSGALRYQGGYAMRLFGPSFALNTAVGAGALANNTTGGGTALGFEALLVNTTGSNNTAIGAYSLSSNTTGSNNTGSGNNALLANTTGVSNTATGSNALYQSTTGSNNTANGASALSSNTTGFQNTATGGSALTADNVGFENTAVGYQSLMSNTSGTNNTAAGVNSLSANVTGNNNTAYGDGALTAGTGNNNTALGYLAGGNIVAGSFNIMVGNQGVSGDDHIIRLGDVQTKTLVAGVRGVTTGNADAIPVVIDSNGQLGTVSSSARFKEDIKDMGDASSNLFRLRPVTYRYKQPYANGSKPLDYGLIAEEVEEVYPDLVAHSKDGQIETVQYMKLTPMLLNEVQKEKEVILRQQEQIGSLEARLAALEALLQGQAAVGSQPR